MEGLKLKRGLCGLGLFADRPFKRFEVVIEYTGETIDDAEADRRSNRYIYEVRKNVNLDASGRRHLARYANHACEPNCYVRIKGDRVFYVAARNIARGEELSIHHDRASYEKGKRKAPADVGLFLIRDRARAGLTDELYRRQ
jgi:SET domain-containing protein